MKYVVHYYVLHFGLFDCYFFYLDLKIFQRRGNFTSHLSHKMLCIVLLIKVLGTRTRRSSYRQEKHPFSTPHACQCNVGRESVEKQTAAFCIFFVNTYKKRESAFVKVISML